MFLFFAQGNVSFLIIEYAAFLGVFYALRSTLGVSMEPRNDGPEGPICLRRVEATAPSFLGPVAAIPRPRTIERRTFPIAARSRRTCFFAPRVRIIK